MSKFGYIEQCEGLYNVFGFDDDRPIDSLQDISAIMLSRLDFDMKFIEIPAVSAHDIHKLLNYRLRGLYPGNPEETVFDYQVLNGKRTKDVVVHITSKKTIEKYREVSQGRPFFLPFTIVSRLSKRYIGTNCLFIFIHKCWIEATVFRDKGFKSSFVMKREKNTKHDLIKLIDLLPEGTDNTRMVFIGPEIIHEEIKKRMDSFLDKNRPYDVISVEELLNGFSKKTNYLFYESQKKRIIKQNVIITILFIIAIILTGLTLDKVVRYRESYYSSLQKRLGSLQSTNMKIVAQRKEIENMENELHVYRKRTPNDVFFILSSLTEVIGNDIEITYFLLEGNSFQFEGEGSNPLEIMERFKRNDTFDNVKLLQIVPIEGAKKERFKVIGAVKAQ